MGEGRAELTETGTTTQPALGWGGGQESPGAHSPEPCPWMAVLSCPAHRPAAVPAISTQLPYGRISWTGSLRLGSLDVGGVPSSPFLAPIRVVTTQKASPTGMSQFPGTPSALHVQKERVRHSRLAASSGSEQGRGPSTESALPVNTQGSWTHAVSPRHTSLHPSAPTETHPKRS